MAKKRRLRTTPKFLIILIVLTLSFAFVIFYSQEQKLSEIRTERSALDEKYQELQNEEQLMEYMIEYSQSDEYKIQYAREKLGYVKPDDTKFDIEENTEPDE